MTTDYKEVPLTADEKDLLNTIFNKRIRLFSAAYLTLIIMAFCSSGHGLKNWNDKEANYDAKIISISQMHFISLSFLECIVIVSGIIIFFKRIWCYKRDIKLGIKGMVPFTIVRKEYFPYTQQYFLGLDDPAYMHHEVDENTYNNCSEGDKVYLRKAIKSNYIFEENGRFTLM